MDERDTVVPTVSLPEHGLEVEFVAGTAGALAVVTPDAAAVRSAEP